MPLDAKAQVLVQAMTQGFALDYSRLAVAEYRAMLARMPLPPSTEALASIVDRTAPGPGGPLAVRIYRPVKERTLPATVFLHGGGFVSCGLDSHDNLCRRLARLSGGVVVAVDYRLAPEAPFPAALEDACAAVRWLRREAPALDIDGSRIAMAGDSAGGNLAAAAAQRLHGEGIVLRHQLLFYPALDPCCGAASFDEFGEAGYLLSTGLMRWFWSQYLADSNENHAPHLCRSQSTHSTYLTLHL